MEQIELDKWFKFLGYGCPNSLLWFVGIEPGGDQANEAMPKQNEYLFNDVRLLFDAHIPQEQNRVWGIAKHLAKSANQAKYFMSNIAPLPRKRETLQLFGIENAEEYQARVIEERVKRLVSIHRNDPKRITVYHGIGARKRYKVLEEFNLNPDSGKCSEQGVLVYETERLIFTNSFAYGFTFPNNKVDFVSELLNKWLSSLHQSD